MPTNPSKKRAKSTAKKKSSRKRAPAKKSVTKKTAAKKSRPAAHEGETLHNVARSIGATLGSFAKSTSDAIKAAKQALPNLKHSKDASE